MMYNALNIPDDEETFEDECELCGFIGDHDSDCVLNKHNFEEDEDEPE